jgi:hypothetical protein
MNMKTRVFTHSILPVAIGSLLCLAPSLRAQEAPAQPAPEVPEKVDPQSLQWPRTFANDSYEFIAYQPQIDSWTGNQLAGRFATGVRPVGTTDETYGVVFFKARTEVDKVNRLVTLEDFQITRAQFPTQQGMQAQYLAILKTFQPKAARVVSLDHLEAVFAVSANIDKTRFQPVKNEPPRIIYTTKPALLILVQGSPVMKKLTAAYERVVNTRAILLLDNDPNYQAYYLSAGGKNYIAPSIEGPWTQALAPPPDLQTAIDAAIATKQVDPMLPKTTGTTPDFQIYVSMTPAELIQTNGVPNMTSIDGTSLLYITNTSSAIFYDINAGQNYLLISGRWFKAASLYGPWSYVAPADLPADFAKIPEESPKSNVLASVPGTPQSKEAVISNSIPQTATINRKEAHLKVVYAGDTPVFKPVQGTPLQYAVNTDTPVIEVKPDSYYACEGGVWFTAAQPVGEWAVASSVPKVIYSIPTSSPIYYVTYAYVYGSTPDEVYVGYTPGYAGTVVSQAGTVVYGTGYDYPPAVYGDVYWSYPPTYGYGASLALGAVTGFAFGFAAGAEFGCWAEPCWGCYGAVPYSYTHININTTNFYSQWGTAVHVNGHYGYNSYTGARWGTQSASTFNPYTGAHGEASRGAGYNPYTGNAAAGRQASYYNPSTGAQGAAREGAAGNVNTGNYAAGKQAAGYNPSTGVYGAGEKGVTGNTHTGQSSSESRGVIGDTKTGNAVAWNNGNVYTDKDGNINKYSTDGATQKYNSSGWQNQSKPASSSGGNYGVFSDSGATKTAGSGGNYGVFSDSSQPRSSASTNSWAQSVGDQRFQGFHDSGGGGWGGQSSWANRSGGGDGGGGFGGFRGGGGGGWGGGGGFRGGGRR